MVCKGLLSGFDSAPLGTFSIGTLLYHFISSPILHMSCNLYLTFRETHTDENGSLFHFAAETELSWLSFLIFQSPTGFIVFY